MPTGTWLSGCYALFELVKDPLKPALCRSRRAEEEWAVDK